MINKHEKLLKNENGKASNDFLSKNMKENLTGLDSSNNINTNEFIIDTTVEDYVNKSDIKWDEIEEPKDKKFIKKGQNTIKENFDDSPKMSEKDIDDDEIIINSHANENLINGINGQRAGHMAPGYELDEKNLVVEDGKLVDHSQYPMHIGRNAQKLDKKALDKRTKKLAELNAEREQAVKLGLDYVVPSPQDYDNPVWTYKTKPGYTRYYKKQITKFMAPECTRKLKLSQETIEQLRLRRDRNLTQWILNSKKYKLPFISWDSKSMKKVKTALADLEAYIAVSRYRSTQPKHRRPVKHQEITEAQRLYKNAIGACSNYVAKKTTHTGAARYNAVREKMRNLIEEYQELRDIDLSMNWHKDRNGEDVGDEWTSEVGTIYGMLYKSRLGKMLPEYKSEMAEKTANEEYKKNTYAVYKEQPDLPEQLPEDASCRTIIDMLTGAGNNSLLVLENKDQSIININLARALLNELGRLKPGESFCFHTALLNAPREGSGRLVQRYKNAHNEEKICNTFIEIKQTLAGNLSFSINGRDNISCSGKEIIMQSLRAKVYACRSFMNQDDNKEYFASIDEEETPGTRVSREILSSLRSESYANAKDYQNEYFDALRNFAADFIKDRVPGIDPILISRSTPERIRITLLYLVDHPFKEQVVIGHESDKHKRARVNREKDDYMFAIRGKLGELNPEGLSYKEVVNTYDEAEKKFIKQFQDEDPDLLYNEASKMSEKKIRENAIAYISNITGLMPEIFEREGMVRTTEQLHNDAVALCKGEIDSIQYQSDFFKDSKRKYAFDVKDALTINSSDILEIMKNSKKNQFENNVVYRQQVQKPVLKENLAKWTSDQKATKEFLADIYYQKATWEEDADIIRKNENDTRRIKDDSYDFERCQKLFSDDTRLDSFIMIAKNPDLIDETIGRIPLFQDEDKNGNFQGIKKNEFKHIKEDIANLMEKAGIDTSLSEKEIKDFFKTKLANKDRENLKAIGGAFNTLSFDLTKLMNDKMSEISTRLEKTVSENLDLTKQKQKKKAKGIKKTSRDQGLTDEEKLKLINKENKEILDDLNKSIITGNSGQAVFLRTLLGKYFGQVHDIDQKSMMAYALRDAKPLPIEKEEPKRLSYDEIKAQVAQLLPAELEQAHKKYDEQLDLYNKGKLKERPIIDSDRIIEEKLKLKLEAKNEKEIKDYAESIKQAKESSLAGLIKGAGPLLQKIIQGIPMECMPETLKNAMIDVKSNLLPIPQEIVTARLNQLIRESGGNITSIEIIKSEGAASIGQAFSAVIKGPEYGPDGQNIIIKMLKPDVITRMKREEKIVTGLANEVDEQIAKESGMPNNGAILKTYQGTLKRINDELDLKIEAKNVVDGGKHYNKSYTWTTFGKYFIPTTHQKNNVKSMELVKNVQPKSDLLLIKKADGVTVDSYLRSVQKKIYENFRDDFTFDKFGRFDKGMIEHDVSELSSSKHRDAEKFIDNIKVIQKNMDEMRQRQEYLVELVQKWITQVFYAGDNNARFFHGDLHAGNIMLDEKGATIIDYGNATTMTKKEGDGMLNLIAAATAGFDVEMPVKVCFDAMVESYQGTAEQKDKMSKFWLGDDGKGNVENQAAVVKLANDIFSKGNAKTVGIKIALFLSQVQSMGMPLPAEIATYAQAQIRLQNTIEEYNKTFEDLKLIQYGYESVIAGGGSSNILYCDMKSSLDAYINSFKTKEQKHIAAENYNLGAMSQVTSPELFYKLFSDESKAGIATLEKLMFPSFIDKNFVGQKKVLVPAKDEKGNVIKNDYGNIEKVPADIEVTPFLDLERDYHECRKMQEQLKTNYSQDLKAKTDERIGKLFKDFKEAINIKYAEYEDLGENPDTHQPIYASTNTPTLMLGKLSDCLINEISVTKEDALTSNVRFLSNNEVLEQLKLLFGNNYDSAEIQELVTKYIKARDKYMEEAVPISADKRQLTGEPKKIYDELNLIVDEIKFAAAKIFMPKAFDLADNAPENAEKPLVTFTEAVGSVLKNNKLSTLSIVGTWATHKGVVEAVADNLENV